MGLYEIDLIELMRDIWGGKYVIIVLAVLGLLFAILSLATAKPSYTANMLLAPAESAGNSARPAGLGQIGAAASAFGINIGSGDSSSFGKYKELLDSERLPAALFERDDLRPIFFGPSYNLKTKKFGRPEGFIFNIKELIKGILGLHTWTSPGPFEMRTVLKTKMSFTLDKLTNFLKISVQGESPQEAEFVLRTVYTQADELLRQSAKEMAANRIRYLNETLAKVTMQDQRDAMINILSSQQRNLMMASVDRTFAVEVIDPPAASTIPTAPVPRLTLVTDILGGAGLGFFMAVIYGLRVRSRRKAAGLPPRSLDQAGLDLFRSLRQRRAIRNRNRTA